MNIQYREADLQISELTVPATGASGHDIPVSFVVTNHGVRATRQSSWTDRVFLSRDPSLDPGDLLLGEAIHQGSLAPAASYRTSLDVRLPDSIEGPFYLLAYADSAADRDRGAESNIGLGLRGVGFERDATLGIFDLVSAAQRNLRRGRIAEYQQEGNNTAIQAIQVQKVQPPDLQVTRVVAPQRVVAGQTFQVTYTVSNLGGDSPTTQPQWDDLVYFLRDRLLDLKSDRYLEVATHKGGLAAGKSYDVTLDLVAPSDMLGSYYLFVVTDPARTDTVGNVFEEYQELNNARAAEPAVSIEHPPASDILVTDIVVPAAAKSGDPLEIRWTVQNIDDQPASGRWLDSVFLSSDTTWDIQDVPLGRAEYNGTLQPGQTYSATLVTELPPAIPGEYHVIVRADVLNQLYEETGDANNTVASLGTIATQVDQLELGVPLPTTLSAGTSRLFQVSAPLDRTLRVSLTSRAATATNELFVRRNAAPTSAIYDAAYEGGLAASQTAVIPSTQPGTYYVLVRGHSQPAPLTPVTVLAELMPLSITRVHTDRAAGARYVTTTIDGAGFSPQAAVHLVRPQWADLQPVSLQVVNATRIRATFDLTSASFSLYDLKVVNPDGEQVVIPYRFQVERLVEPEVTIGVGGPRAILAGDQATYSVALQNLGNLDAPYTYFQVGIPEMGTSLMVYGLPFVHMFTNVRGRPDLDALSDTPWSNLESVLNLNGHNLASGYLVSHDADGFTGFTFNVATYPGLSEMHDRAFEQLRERIYAVFPQFAALGILDDGPAGLDLIMPGLADTWNRLGAIPSDLVIPFVPFQFHVVAAATSLTRDEFVAHLLQNAERVRQSVLDDPTAPAALLALAADGAVWGQLHLAACEQAGLLQPAGTAPPVRERPEILSLMALLTSGLLAGPAGSELRSGGDLLSFFEKLRTWYGHDEELLAPADPNVKPNHLNAVPQIPDFAEFDLGTSLPTHYEAFRVYVPWVPFEKRGAGLPPDFQIGQVDLTGGDEFAALDLSAYLQGQGAVSGLASLVGPFTGDTHGLLPAGQALPYTVHFQNDPVSSSHVSEVRIVTPLDPHLDARTFRLGDIRIGDVDIQMPPERGVFQQDFDFQRTKGFVLRVSAGVDLVAGEATWLLQAIDPLTGELIQDTHRGLLPPNDALGSGSGFVSYSILPAQDVETGTEIQASARVLMNTTPPEDTPLLRQTIDAVAPTTQLSLTGLNAEGTRVRVAWQSVDDAAGGGVRHVTLYVAENGGDFRIWRRKLESASGVDVFDGLPGVQYEFLALATDVAGNREQPPLGVSAGDDGSATNLGSLPTVPSTTPPNFGIAPEPTPEPSTNPLFVQAELGIVNNSPVQQPSEFARVLQPFEVRAFVTGIQQSHANIGPMAIAEAPDGSFLISGGPGRNQLFRVTSAGAHATQPIAELSYPVFGLAFAANGTLWATTGGGPLLRLDPTSGQILDFFGDGLTMALAVEPATGRIYVSSAEGIEVFDPQSENFEHFSRDRNLRVGGLAFDNNGQLWATTWPDRRQVVRFTARRLRRDDARLRFGHRLARVRRRRHSAARPAAGFA